MSLSAAAKQDLLSGAFIYVFLLGVFIQTRRLPFDSALFPNMCMALLTLLNTVMCVVAFRKRGESAVSWGLVKMPLLYFAAVVVYVVIFKYLGYFPSTAIMLVCLMAVSKVRPWWKVAAITVGYTAFIYVLFIMWLKVSLI